MHDADDLLDFDREHLWHPYSSMTSPGTVDPVPPASGTRLTLEVDGAEREVGVTCTCIRRRHCVQKRGGSMRSRSLQASWRPAPAGSPQCPQ